MSEIVYVGKATTKIEISAGSRGQHKIPVGDQVGVYRDANRPEAGYLVKFPELKTLQGFFEPECFTDPQPRNIIQEVFYRHSQKSKLLKIEPNQIVGVNLWLHPDGTLQVYIMRPIEYGDIEIRAKGDFEVLQETERGTYGLLFKEDKP